VKPRTLQVSLKKKDKNDTTDDESCVIDLESKVAVIGRAFQRFATTVGTGVIIYVLADTARQVIIAKTTVNPPS
jgi:hypothetical protein